MKGFTTDRLIAYVCIASKDLLIPNHPRGAKPAFQASVMQDIARLHLEYPDVTFISPSIQNYEMLPYLPELPADYGGWRVRCENLMRISDYFVVMKTPNWRESVGVGEEIKFANANSKPIYYYPGLGDS